MTVQVANRTEQTRLILAAILKNMGQNEWCRANYWTSTYFGSIGGTGACFCDRQKTVKNESACDKKSVESFQIYSGRYCSWLPKIFISTCSRWVCSVILLPRDSFSREPIETLRIQVFSGKNYDTDVLVKSIQGLGFDIKITT